MASSTQPEFQPTHPLNRRPDSRAADWLRNNGRVVGGALAVVAAFGVGTVAWRSSGRAKELRAEQAFFQAQAASSQGQGGAAATERGLRDVASRYPDTPGGAQATLLLAQALYDQGRFPDGLAVLSRAKVPDQFASAVKLLTAAGYEGSGRAGAAAQLYEEQSNAAGTVGRRRDELRAAAGRAYVLADDKVGATRVWRAIVAQGAKGSVDEARIRLGELEAR